jgi:hypothetical protein
MRWTGREARILRETALRMTIRDFAAHTQLSTYAIRDFEAKGEQANLRTSTQKILDATLAAAAEDAQQRFAVAVGRNASPEEVVTNRRQVLATALGLASAEAAGLATARMFRMDVLSLLGSPPPTSELLDVDQYGSVEAIEELTRGLWRLYWSAQPHPL